MDYFLGIDVSTTAAKALLIDGRGSLIGVASLEYGYDIPHPLWSEQDPALWWEGTVQSIRSLMKKTGAEPGQVTGMGLTGQMHGLVLLDKYGEVLRPAILWNDQRTADQCDEIRARLGKDRLIRITGNDALTGFTAPKILWVQQQEPEIWRQTRHILLPKDYVRYRLTGDYAMDKADGSGTILFDLNQRDWSGEMLDALGIPPDYLPPTYEGTLVTGRLTSQAAQLLRLPEGIPVFAGGGDQAAGAVGTGAVEEGIVSLSLGTSGVVFASVDSPVIEQEGRLHAFCHAVPGKWHLMGVMLSAAGSLRWLRDTLAPGISYDDLLGPAADVPTCSDGLLFLPYLTGERTPHPDPLARGAFVGLTVRHGLAHMTRAVLEGVAFGLRDSFELMKQAGLPEVSQVRVTGGGARSALWRQILVDVLGCELIVVNTSEGAAYGAALLAAVGTGAWPDVSTACRAVIKITGSTVPDAGRVELYNKVYELYGELYPALKTVFEHLGSCSQLDK